MKNILIHICCAPCLAAPYFHLREEGWQVQGLWYNHNIHPYLEYQKRFKTLQKFAKDEEIPLIIKDKYELDIFLRQAAFREGDRCRSCYYHRLKQAAIEAKKGNFTCFTTTLLYSKHQQHELIREIGEALGKEYDIPFYYQDFRQYWQEGIQLSKSREMYRQQYCGCIYSERDRYLQRS